MNRSEKRSCLGIALATALCACGGSSAGDPAPNVAPQPAPTSPVPATPVAPPAAGDSARVGGSVNDFGLALYRAAAAPRGNFVVSPASVYLALAMTEAGARNETEREMVAAMRLARVGDAPHALIGQQQRVWAEPHEGYTLRVVNRLFGERSFTFEQPYLQLVEGTYAAPLEPTDFRNAAPAARTRINDYVAEQTEQRIRNLVPEGLLTDDTRLVLVNAVYFLAEWAEKFEHSATFSQPFYVDGAATGAQTPLMHALQQQRYVHQDGVSAIELPYAGGEVSMLVLLPDARDGVAALERDLSVEKLDAIVAAMQPTRVAIALPKFRLEPGEPLRLRDALVAMGMRSAFDDGAADFSAIAPIGDTRLYVSEVLHKAFVRVDEEGTEAAAATAVVMAEGGAAMMDRPPEMTVDHPFLFAIRDTRSGALLFLGRVTDPRGLP